MDKVYMIHGIVFSCDIYEETDLIEEAFETEDLANRYILEQKLLERYKEVSVWSIPFHGDTYGKG